MRYRTRDFRMATFKGTDSRNVISGTNYSDVIYGYGGDDDLFGNDGHDDLLGGAGNDYLSGGYGDDYLSGGSGSDRLVGGAGYDELVGGSGRDVMTGGTGEDVFVFDFASDSQAGFSSRDIITDFTLDVDLIDLSGIDAQANAYGNQAFFFGGYDTKFDYQGEVRYQYVDTDGNGYRDSTLISGNTDGDQTAEFQIELSGLKNLNEFDFFL